MTLWQTKYADKIPKNGASIAPALNRAVPWESLLRGVGKTTRRVSETTPGPSRKSVAAKQNTRGKLRKTSHKKRGNTPAASRPRKGASEPAPGESQKRAGPRMAPRQTTKKQDARPKRAKQAKAAGRKQRKGTSKTGACEGVSCYYLNCLNREKRRR